MPKRTKQDRDHQPPKPEKVRGPQKTPANKRLTEQTRKILGKHYASKYRVR